MVRICWKPQGYLTFLENTKKPRTCNFCSILGERVYIKCIPLRNFRSEQSKQSSKPRLCDFFIKLWKRSPTPRIRPHPRQDFSTWIRDRIAQYDFLENKDYISFHKKWSERSVVRICWKSRLCLGFIILWNPKSGTNLWRMKIKTSFGFPKIMKPNYRKSLIFPLHKKMERKNQWLTIIGKVVLSGTTLWNPKSKWTTWLTK